MKHFLNQRNKVSNNFHSFENISSTTKLWYVVYLYPSKDVYIYLTS